MGATIGKQPVKINLDNLDVYFVIDQSGSMGPGMGTEMPNGQTRWDYSKETILPFATDLGAHDDDGLSYVFFNRRMTVADNVKPDGIVSEFNKRQPGGGTDMVQPLDYTFGLAIKRMGEKQQYIGFLTDGAPDEGTEDKVIASIVNATKQIATDGKVCLHFIQVGNDSKAAAFLKQLDEKLEAEGAQHDIVAVSNLDDLAGKPIQQIVEEAFNG